MAYDTKHKRGTAGGAWRVTYLQDRVEETVCSGDVYEARITEVVVFVCRFF